MKKKQETLTKIMYLYICSISRPHKWRLVEALMQRYYSHNHSPDPPQLLYILSPKGFSPFIVLSPPDGDVSYLLLSI